MLSDAKHIGLDVHQATPSAAVLDSVDKLLMESTSDAVIQSNTRLVPSPTLN